MRLGLGLSLTTPRGGGAAWTPAALFSASETGAWYEPGPTNCFQDTAGTTPAGAGDPVGRISDLSGNGNHATQATAAARPTLRQTAGGLWYLDFDGVDDRLEVPIEVGTNPFISIAVESEALTPTRQHFLRDGSSVWGMIFRYGDANANVSIFLKNDSGIEVQVQGLSAGPYEKEVISTRYDGSNLILRRNATQVGSSPMTGQSFVGATSTFLGSEVTAVNLFNGKMFGLIWRNALTDNANMVAAEAYLADRSGVTL